MEGTGGPWSGWWLVMTHRDRDRERIRRVLTHRDRDREGQCHCLVSEIGGNLLGY